MKKLTLVALLSLLPVFLPGAAQAQVAGIIDEFCQETQDAADDAVFELSEASNDLEECVVEFDDCLSGLFGRDPVECSRDYLRCIKVGQRDQRQACTDFVDEFKAAYRQALRRADREDVDDEFLLWFYSSASEECLAPVRSTAALCAGVTSD